MLGGGGRVFRLNSSFSIRRSARTIFSASGGTTHPASCGTTHLQLQDYQGRKDTMSAFTSRGVARGAENVLKNAARNLGAQQIERLKYTDIVQNLKGNPEFMNPLRAHVRGVSKASEFAMGVGSEALEKALTPVYGEKGRYAAAFVADLLNDTLTLVFDDLKREVEDEEAFGNIVDAQVTKALTRVLPATATGGEAVVESFLNMDIMHVPGCPTQLRNEQRAQSLFRVHLLQSKSGSGGAMGRYDFENGEYHKTSMTVERATAMRAMPCRDCHATANRLLTGSGDSPKELSAWDKLGEDTTRQLGRVAAAVVKHAKADGHDIAMHDMIEQLRENPDPHMLRAIAGYANPDGTVSEQDVSAAAALILMAGGHPSVDKQAEQWVRSMWRWLVRDREWRRMPFRLWLRESGPAAFGVGVCLFLVAVSFCFGGWDWLKSFGASGMEIGLPGQVILLLHGAFMLPLLLTMLFVQWVINLVGGVAGVVRRVLVGIAKGINLELEPMSALEAFDRREAVGKIAFSAIALVFSLTGVRLGVLSIEWSTHNHGAGLLGGLAAAVLICFLIAHAAEVNRYKNTVEAVRAQAELSAHGNTRTLQFGIWKVAIGLLLLGLGAGLFYVMPKKLEGSTAHVENPASKRDDWKMFMRGVSYKASDVLGIYAGTAKVCYDGVIHVKPSEEGILPSFHHNYEVRPNGTIRAHWDGTAYLRYAANLSEILMPDSYLIDLLTIIGTSCKVVGTKAVGEEVFVDTDPTTCQDVAGEVTSPNRRVWKIEKQLSGKLLAILQSPNAVAKPPSLLKRAGVWLENRLDREEGPVRSVLSGITHGFFILVFLGVFVLGLKNDWGLTSVGLGFFGGLAMLTTALHWLLF